ncbi:hypothetical protein AALP_AA6G334900 [Arabis alpina]|uniref:Nicotianamine synthase n=1 Tax=Arabis alpina TaxID=50452 RepID=A0A087GTC9_ARAAL|nr:hypothetical protein AALP_AA6G334900 [Arabis alpina]
MCLDTDANIDVTKLSQEDQDMRFNLINLCGEAVGCLEEHFSTVCGSLEDNPINHLDLFPHYTKYLNLGKTEFDPLKQHTTHVPTRIAFVGSGPMPMSSIILAKYHLPNTTFHNIDIRPQANALASRLVSRDLDLSRRMTFHTTDLFDMTTEILSGYEVIFLAALVGLDKEAKVKAIEHLEKHMAPGALLMLRSAHGLRAFLCHTIDPCDLKGFEILKIYRTVTNEFVNMVVMIARKLGGHIKTVVNNEAS